MTRRSTCLLAAFVLICLPHSSRGGFVYSDNFDSGASMGTASAYYSDASSDNGLVVKSENLFSTGGITHDVSGNGYFLFNGTAGTAPTVPAGQTAFYISQSFAVTQNTAYTVSFYLANDNNGNLAQVSPEINGVALTSSPVSAVGTFQTNGFQQFTFTYNSGSATTDTLTLRNLQLSGNTGGNDFAVDNIQVSSSGAVPEPSSLALCGIAALMGLGLTARRRWDSR